MLRNEGSRAISVRHVSTGDDFIDSSGIIFLVPFLPPWRQWHYLQIILSCQALRYGCLDTLNIKIRLQTAETIFLVPFLATREAVAPLANDPIMFRRSMRSSRHLEHQNQSIISEDIGRARMVQQLRRRRIGGVGSEEEYSCLRG